MPESPEGIEWARAKSARQTLLLEGGHASGSGGCNRFAGGYLLHGDRLAFEPLASTRMACELEIMEAESEYFAALGQTAQLLVEDGELVLADAAGDELLRFARAVPATDLQEPSWS